MRGVLFTMRTIKIKFFVLTFILLVVYLLLFYFFLVKWFGHETETVVYSAVALKYVVVHLDLKGSPPKLKYLESLLPTLKDFGVNGILMEYEDMFPYEGKLVNLSAKNCYDRHELRNFLNKSVRSGMEIMPLVQTFGHMEHALKLQEFKHLRESAKYPDSICPSNPRSQELIKDMLEQVLNFHNSILPLKHIHIGCDEVFHINECAQCPNKSIANINIFFQHVQLVNNIVQKLSPRITVLIWDDMLRSMKQLQWIDIDLNKLEPVYWDYGSKLSVSHTNMFNYHKKFDNIWIASAFKGADGRTATIPNIKNRFMNHLCWLDLIIDYKFGGETKVYNYKGIILTGWSRYSHMDPLCELLPASMPSLILNLLLIQRMRKGIVLADAANMDFDEFFEKYLDSDFKKIFKCKNMNYIDDFDNAACTFENSELYNGFKQFYHIDSEIKDGFSNDESILRSAEYYSKIKNINMNSVQTNIKWCKQALKKISDLETKLTKYMSPFYEEDVIEEYLGYKTYESKTKVRNTLEVLKRYVEIHTWERKPVQSNISAT